MSKHVLVFGATGLVGRQCVEQLIESPEIDLVYALTRRELPIKSNKLVTLLTDFKDIKLVLSELQVDSAICTLGTTIKQAKSKERFTAIEYGIPLTIAQRLKELGCKEFVYLSSVGADKNSKNFYLQTKGKIEFALEELCFSSLGIVRPSLLLGSRAEKRIAEDLGKWFARGINWIVPKRYRAVESSKVAEKLAELALNTQQGVSVFENEVIN